MALSTSFLLITFGLFHVSHQQSDKGSSLSNVQSCEGSSAQLSCAAGQVIIVVAASYGRTDSVTCPGTGMTVTNCIQPNVMNIVSTLCTGLSQCSVSSSNSVFGDPCGGTTKYLNISYTCTAVGLSRVQSCEGSSAQLSCTTGQVINVVAASYGRTDSVTCPGTGSGITVTNCIEPNATNIVYTMCTGLSQCTVPATNSVFGDPCYLTTKYLNINYYCTDITTTAPACEDTSTQWACPTNQLTFITSAFYGRQSTTICPGSKATNTTCSLATATRVVQQNCNGRISCNTKSSNLYFTTDPCPGTSKYMTVSYFCGATTYIQPGSM